VFFAELSIIKRIHTGYALESVRGRNSQDVIDLFLGFLATGIPRCRALSSDGVDLDTDDSGFFEESEERLILLRART